DRSSVHNSADFQWRRKAQKMRPYFKSADNAQILRMRAALRLPRYGESSCSHARRGARECGQHPRLLGIFGAKCLSRRLLLVPRESDAVGTNNSTNVRLTRTKSSLFQ